MNPTMLARLAKRLSEQTALDNKEQPLRRAVPLSFVEFAKLCDITLTPGQEELARVAFDGHQPNPVMTVWGFSTDIPTVHGSLGGALSRVIVAVFGRGSGKSLLLGLRAVHLGLTVDVSKLAKRETASIPIVAPDLETARVTLRYALGGAEAALGEQSLFNVTADGFSFRRENGRVVRIECRAASAGGKSIRGRSMPAAIMDECAFFRDVNNVVNDTDVYRALMPRIMPGGQLLVASTPWTEKGLLFEFYRDNFKSPQTALVAHAPTTVMRDDIDTQMMVANARKEDAVSARREFDAEFLPRDASSFFDGRAISLAVDPSIALPSEKRERVEYFVGADFGFSRDSSALVVVEREHDIVRVVCIDEQIPSDSPLIPSQVCSTFAESVKKYEAVGLIADSHYREAVREHLEAAGLSLMSAPEGAAGKSTTYAVAKTLLNQGRVRLPNHPRLLNQLRDITVRPTAAGGISIQTPRVKGGGHGDIVSALVLALWQSQRNYVPFQESKHSCMDEQEKLEVERFEREEDEKKQWEIELPEYLR